MKIGLDWSSKLQEINERKEQKTPLLHYFVCFQMHTKAPAAEVEYYLSEKLPLSQTVISEGAVSHNVLFYQQLSIAHYQISLYANNNFE